MGVGTISPENPIEIETTNKLGGTFTGTTDGEGLRVTQTNYTSGNYISLVEAPFDDSQTAANVRIGAMFDGGGSNLAFGTSNSYGSGITNTAMFIHSSGNVQLSGGISFAGNDVETAANALDDYEEGTFTATLTADSIAPSTPPTATFSYTKIGRLVHINGAFSAANVTGASGAIRITGLPFAISSARASGDVMFNYLADVGTVAFNAAVYVTGSDIVFYSSNDAGSWGAIQINAGTGRDVILSATYQTG